MIWVSKHPNLDYTDCSVLCTPTILPAIRISWDKNPTFMLISGRAPRSFIHPCASTGGLRPFDTVILIGNCDEFPIKQKHFVQTMRTRTKRNCCFASVRGAGKKDVLLIILNA